MITADKKQQIHKALKTLAASHAAAVSHIEEAISILSRTLELDEFHQISALTEADRNSDSFSPESPVADRETLRVIWRDKNCFLGNTRLFWFFHRLAQSPNRYVSNDDLLDDVWPVPVESSSIRGVVKRLRDRLVESGMDELAQSIDGNVSGHYGLILA